MHKLTIKFACVGLLILILKANYIPHIDCYC